MTLQSITHFISPKIQKNKGFRKKSITVSKTSIEAVHCLLLTKPIKNVGLYKNIEIFI